MLLNCLETVDICHHIVWTHARVADADGFRRGGWRGEIEINEGETFVACMHTHPVGRNRIRKSFPIKTFPIFSIRTMSVNAVRCNHEIIPANALVIDFF